MIFTVFTIYLYTSYILNTLYIQSYTFTMYIYGIYDYTQQEARKVAGEYERETCLS